MKTKNLTSPLLFLGLMLNLALLPSLATQNQEAQETEPRFIPQEIKSVFQEGIESRQARLDIPFTIIKQLYLPARQNLHSIFFFKIKNADLGFFALPVVPESPEKKEEKEKEKTPPPESEAAPTILQASSNIFLQFNRLENNVPGEVVKEVYIPFNLQEEGASYQPDKEELYTTGYPLPPGNYLLSMAITSLDLKRIGTQYFEFSLPDATSFTDSLETTPILFVKSIKRMAAAEIQAEVHKDFFTYSVLQMEPNLENIFSPGANLDIFVYIFGVQPAENGKCNVEVTYEVLKGEESFIRYDQATYDAPIISQPLPLKRTVTIKSEEAGEKKEVRDIEPGNYTLSIKVTDKVSGNSVEKTIDFEVK